MQAIGLRGAFVAALLVFFVGPLCDVLLVQGYLASRAFETSAVSANGQVVDKSQRVQRVESYDGSRDLRVKLVDLRYDLRDGAMRVATVEVSDYLYDRVTQWQTVPLRYDPDNPEYVQVEPGRRQVLNVGLMVLGLVCTIFGGSGFWRVWRLPRV